MTAMQTDLAALESLFLGLADKTRLRLLSFMAAGPVSVGHLVSETGESQPKISRHLAYLRNAGLVDTTRDGKWIYYGLTTLADGSADSVFRCVVEELSGRETPAGQRRRYVENSAAHTIIEPEYLAPDENGDWNDPEFDSTGTREELPVFLL